VFAFVFVKTVDSGDVEADHSSDADELSRLSEDVNSHQAPHPKCSDSKWEMNKTCHASESETTQDTGKCHSQGDHLYGNVRDLTAVSEMSWKCQRKNLIMEKSGLKLSHPDWF